MANGESFPIGAGNREPKRPAICVLMPDLAEPESPPGVLGMYPSSLIPKLLPWLQCDRSKVLHVCSGGLPPGEGIRVDIRPEAKPDIVADGRELPLEDSSVDAVLIDPPYSEHYARELYGTEYPRPSHLLREAARVVKPNGRIGIVHYIVPNPPDGTVFIVSMGLSMGFGYPMRAITIYERRQLSLFAGEAPPPNPRAARRKRKGMP
jgi:SAM-dependent methyltransferase